MKTISRLSATAIVGLVLVTMASLTQSRVLLPDSLAINLTGGQCWTLPAYACPLMGSTCGATLCVNNGVFFDDWVCPSGSVQNDRLPVYKYCTEAANGRDSCFVPDQTLWQVCWARRDCASPCLQSAVDGRFYCAGPVGDPRPVVIFPVPQLGPEVCPPPVA